MLKDKISKHTMDYMIGGIRHVCATFKKRAPGTQSERDAQAFFKDELGKLSDDVIMEDFTLHPHAFMGFIPVTAVFLLASVALYWFGGSSLAVSVIRVVLPLLAVLMFIVEFMMYRELVDVFFPKRISRNVYATRKPKGEVKRRIIFGGHTDAAYEWTYALHGQIKALATVIGSAVVSMIIVTAVNIAFFVKTLMSSDPIAIEGIWKTLGIVMLCCIPSAIAISLFTNWRVIVDGANDNLSANYIAMSVLKEMQDNDFRFENTEVACLLTGSEEAGLRGAEAFARKHKQDLSEIETVFIAMDTMREVDQLMIYTRGCTGTVKNSDAVGRLLHEAGMNCGIDMPIAGLYPGAVDAEAFSRNGLLAAGFNGVNHNPQLYYHTRHDTPDNISPECIELSLKICLEAAELFDKNGIKKYE
ncbi:MAG: M28 family metallopeptidase [Oscillospiraceae bacterium]|nr:M28 family metallopeptidase [Oscillospiraceae bacterium]